MSKIPREYYWLKIIKCLLKQSCGSICCAASAIGCGGAGVLRAEFPLPALQGSPEERLGLRELALGLEEAAQVVRARKGVGLVRAELAVSQLEDLPLPRLPEPHRRRVAYLRNSEPTRPCQMMLDFRGWVPRHLAHLYRSLPCCIEFLMLLRFARHIMPQCKHVVRKR